MSAHSIDDNKVSDCVARTGVSLIIAVMAISSLPLILGMVVWLPGWLEQCGLAIAHVALF